MAKHVVIILVVVHLLALFVGGPAWLYASGRLSEARLWEVVDIFRKTIEQEEADRLAAEKEIAEQERRARTAARLERVGDGLTRIDNRLAMQKLADEVAMQRVARLERTIQDLRRTLDARMEQVREAKAALDVEREAFEKAKQAYMDRMTDEHFQQAVALYENVPSKQAKEMFMQLIERGGQEQVVDYLIAMQQRKAAAVLKQFKEEDEAPIVTALLERLRVRGVEFIDERLASREGS